ncbi:hypothetical protein M2306_002302 [Myroides gitamensis]|uniref:DUF4272 domain-containing protein n=1 Tax=Myroides odoratus TaxID=256 RepID=A0A378U490_MYROD|nr:DUF4272 domain-containing protein [Myroides odoratus]MCS4237652.1 hypothetical protein [Myroides odoratus]MDH6601608.1 hypothetical protein [Myroides gitamensis]QQU02822.1 DUF4272 domain-containing protein [Myroides odoratus]STZ69946.1 Uncharacterised protein [Myroides odoratus]
MNLTEEQRIAIKEANIARIAKKNYRYIDWLPILENPNLRSQDELIGRMSVMNALINISFEAPVEIIKQWIEDQQLSHHLSTWEKEILTKTQEDLDQYEINTLRWYLEALWALMWATKMIPHLDETQWNEESMASMLPNLEEGEDNHRLQEVTTMHTTEDIYSMLDFYYRLHWYCVDERLKGQEAVINEGLVYERRRALEWLINKETDWDEIEMGT